MNWNKKVGTRLSGSLKAKILLSLGSAIILLVFATVGLSLLKFTEYADNAAKLSAIRGMEGVSFKLQETREKAGQYARLIAGNPGFITAMKQGDKNSLLPLIRHILNAGAIDSLVVTDQRGMVVTSTDTLEQSGSNAMGWASVQKAVQGNSYSAIEPHEVMKLAATACEPVKNGGMVIGSVTVRFALNKEAILDEIKTKYQTDATLFLGDTRINTTIIKDGQRVIGTTLDPVIADRVLNKNEKFQGKTLILGLQYVTSYMPLTGADGKAIGVIFAGQSVAEIVKSTYETLFLVGSIAFLGVVLIIAFLFVFLDRNIFKPVNYLVEIANRLAVGDVNITVEADSNDEIGKLLKAFRAMIANIQAWAVAAERIAEGDFSVAVEAKSENDILAIKLKQMLETINRLKNEMDALIHAAQTGKLGERGDASGFVGNWAGMIQGINDLLDAVIKPINEASGVLQEVAKGNLQVYVAGNYQGDHAQIKDALNRTIESLRKHIEEISRVLTEMSRGNLNIEVSNTYEGDFTQMQDSLKLIIDSFNQIINKMDASAEQINSGAKQVATSSQNLSQGSTEQAGAIEEISSSIRDIAEQTKQNAVNANQASNLAGLTKECAVQGNEQMKDLLKAIAEINASSANISKIIKVIDEIAFQTNILALNAAVEAARAGLSGKGFAVVADEVRNLAGRSANAAKEIAEMLEGMIQKVAAGSALTQETASALDRIVNEVTNAATLVGGIAAASNAQATAITQINQGISQVSSVVQSATAMSEQSAAASEELSSQAEILKSMVKRFKIKDRISEDPSFPVKKPLETVSKKQVNILLDDVEFGKY